MARFLHEYAGTNWIGWLIICCILSVPFFWEKLRTAPVFYLQVLNFFFTQFVGSLFGGTAHSMTGDHAMGTAVFTGFGIGYSLQALRNPSTLERALGVVFLLIFGSMMAILVFRKWPYM